MKCNNCKLWRKNCTLNTNFIPEYLPQSQRDKWIEAWYEQAQYDEACEEFEEKP